MSARVSDLSEFALKDKFIYERENALLTNRLRSANRRIAALEHKVELLESSDRTLYQLLLKLIPFAPERLKKVIRDDVRI